jgi:hypothetical protein
MFYLVAGATVVVVVAIAAGATVSTTAPTSVAIVVSAATAVSAATSTTGAFVVILDHKAFAQAGCGIFQPINIPTNKTISDVWENKPLLKKLIIVSIIEPHIEYKEKYLVSNIYG